MKLIEHIKETKFSKTVYAKELGVSRGTLYRILGGDSITLDVANRIVTYTNGKVSYEELVNE